MPRFFISYSHCDQSFADMFVLLLRRVYGNDAVWYDEDIPGSAIWPQMIVDKIQTCDVFVFLLSDHSCKSTYCQSEFREALEQGKQILPVIVGNLKTPYPGDISSDLAKVLADVEYIDMSAVSHSTSTFQIAKLYQAAKFALETALKHTRRSSDKIAPYPVRLVAGMKRIGDDFYTNQLPNLKLGDKIRVKCGAINSSGREISDIHFYSVFTHSGIRVWLNCDHIGKIGVPYLPFTVPNGASLQYTENSTYFETNISGVWQGSTVPDVPGYCASRLFINDSRGDVGFHIYHFPSGDNFQYVVYYDVEVAPTNCAVYNAHPSDQPLLQVRKPDSSLPDWSTNLEDLKLGDELEFKFYAHNNPRGTVAIGSSVGFCNWNDGPANHLDLVGYVSAENAERKTGNVSLSFRQPARLEYILASTKFQGHPTLYGVPYNRNAPQADGIVDPEGIMIGNQGRHEGCWDFLMTVTLRAKVKPHRVN